MQQQQNTSCARAIVAGFLAVAAFCAIAAPTRAAIEPRRILKTYFETGDVPTEEQFKDLIDSFVHQTEDGLTIYRIGVTGPGSLIAGRKVEDDVIDDTLDYAEIAPGGEPPAMAPEFGGRSGFLPLQLSDMLGNSYFGYFQIRMDDPLLIDPPGIHVDYFVYEDSGQPLTATFVPEPAIGALLLVPLVMLKRMRR